MKKQTVIVVSACAIVTLLVIAFYLSNYPPQDRVSLAVNYLKSHFNEERGLIYESEDPGVIEINGVNYSHNQIYYVYSDNLLAEWALKPYDRRISNRINETILGYRLEGSGLFEVLFGETIPLNISTDIKPIIEQHQDYVILSEFHNTSDTLLWEGYGNTLVYRALNLHLPNPTDEEVRQCFEKACAMWDGRGIYDDATKKDGKYANYKLALVLYASKVLDLPFGNYTRIEEKLWSMQQSNGGITSLADLSGNPIGSANTETTALALLASE